MKKLIGIFSFLLSSSLWASPCWNAVAEIVTDPVSIILGKEAGQVLPVNLGKEELINRSVTIFYFNQEGTEVAAKGKLKQLPQAQGFGLQASNQAPNPYYILLRDNAAPIAIESNLVTNIELNEVRTPLYQQYNLVYGTFLDLPFERFHDGRLKLAYFSKDDLIDRSYAVLVLDEKNPAQSRIVVGKLIDMPEEKFGFSSQQNDHFIIQDEQGIQHAIDPRKIHSIKSLESRHYDAQSLFSAFEGMYPNWLPGQLKINAIGKLQLNDFDAGQTPHVAILLRSKENLLEPVIIEGKLLKLPDTPTIGYGTHGKDFYFHLELENGEVIALELEEINAMLIRP